MNSRLKSSPSQPLTGTDPERCVVPYDEKQGGVFTEVPAEHGHMDGFLNFIHALMVNDNIWNDKSTIIHCFMVDFCYYVEVFQVVCICSALDPHKMLYMDYELPKMHVMFISTK